MTGSPDSSRVQSVRNAWTQVLRNEVIRTGDTTIAKIAHVGVWLATYGDADGSNCYPGADTLATLTGSAKATVGRALRVLRAVGLITAKRRPNDTTIYQLRMPIGGKVDWAPHLHLYTENPQKKARAKRKQADIAEYLAARNRSPDNIRNRSAMGVPEVIRDGGSDPPKSGIQEARKCSADTSGSAPRTTSGSDPRRGGTSTSLPPVGTPSYDQDMADHSPQPQAARASPPRKAIQPPLMTAVPQPPPTTAGEQPGGLTEYQRTRAAEQQRRGVRPPLPDRERPAS